jgi:hypothetical protein
MQKLNLLIRVIVVTVVMVLLCSAQTYADAIGTTFGVSFDTSSLRSLGPLDLAFVLTDGSGTGDSNTTVKLTNFLFDSGSGPSTESLVDSQFFNQILAPFSPGDKLSFKVQILSSSIDQPTPDLFQFAILQASGLPLQTTDPSGLDTLVTVDVTSPLSPQVFAISSVPEPSSILLLVSGLVILTFLGLRLHRFGN